MTQPRKPTHEVIVTETDGEWELIAEGTARQMQTVIEELIAEHAPESGEAYAGLPLPAYTVRKIEW